jgi:hypothetical protein
MPPSPQDKLLGTVFAQNLLIQSQIKAFVTLIELVARQAGLDALTGDPLKAVFSRLTDEHQKALLLTLEDKNPAMAALVSSVLDSARTDGKGLF